VLKPHHAHPPPHEGITLSSRRRPLGLHRAGPHLYAGAGVVVCWAMAASLVPLMSKGKDAARTAHIAFNVLALGLFTWQLPTGWDITLKVIKFTKFP